MFEFEKLTKPDWVLIACAFISVALLLSFGVYRLVGA
jgi:hypothetical protein